MLQYAEHVPLLCLTSNWKTPRFQSLQSKKTRMTPSSITLPETVVNTFLLSLNNPTIDKFSEVELLKLLSSYSNLNFTLSEQDKLIGEIPLNH